MLNARISSISMSLAIEKDKYAPLSMRNSVFYCDEWVFLTNFTQNAIAGSHLETYFIMPRTFAS